MSTTNFDRFDLATTGDNVREDLTSVIYNISPTEVPYQANAGRGTALQTLHEWQIDELDAVDTGKILPLRRATGVAKRVNSGETPCGAILSQAA